MRFGKLTALTNIRCYGRWKTTFGGRWHSVEDNLWWKTTLGGRRPLGEDDLGRKTTFDRRWPSVDACMRSSPFFSIFSCQIHLAFANNTDLCCNNVHIFLCTYTYNNPYTHIDTHTEIHTHTYTNTPIILRQPHKHPHTNTPTPTHTHTHTNIHTHIHTIYFLGVESLMPNLFYQEWRPHDAPTTPPRLPNQEQLWKMQSKISFLD